MELKVVKGETIEEQITSIDRLLWHYKSLIQVGGNTTVGAMSPIPIFQKCALPDTHGQVMKILIPMNCKITDAMIYFGLKKIEELVLSVTLETPTRAGTDKISIKDELTQFSLNWTIEKGSIVTCTVNEPHEVEDILIAFLAFPELSDTQQMDFTQLQIAQRMKERGRKAKSSEETPPEGSSGPHRRTNRG
jgi:hypothetical protein